MAQNNKNTEYVPMKDPKYCCVPICKNNSRIAPKKSFFSLPVSTKQEWCNVLTITCPKRVLYILCEDHLNLEDDLENFQYWKAVKGRPILKPRLPQFLRPNLDDISEPRPSTSSFNVDKVSLDWNPPTPNANRSKLSKGIQVRPNANQSSLSKGIQVKPKTSDRATSCMIHKNKMTKPTTVHEHFQNDEELPSTQGSTTSNAEISEVSSEVGVSKTLHGRSFMLDLIKRKPLNYLGLPKTYLWLIEYLESNLKLKAFNIIVTLYKIRNNTTFYQISDMFEVSLSTLWRIFFKTLYILFQYFKQFIFCPSLYQVKRNLPAVFTSLKEYSNIYCIIDCFEIQIEKPSNPVNQSLTWSQYKNANTLKYLMATTPHGFVNFVSAGFGGRTSDAVIVEKSGLLDALPPGCTILADRGFKHIDVLLSNHNIKLLRPPSVSKGVQLSKQEAIKSKSIASLRVHVERVIRRVRLFKLLKPHSVVNNKLVLHTMCHVVIVACGLINLQSPIINNK